MIAYQTSDVETFGHNDSTLHTLLEHCACDKNQQVVYGSCTDKVEIDMLLGVADLSQQLLSLQDFLRVLYLKVS